MSSSLTPAAPRVALHTIFGFGALGIPVAVMGLIFGVYLPRHYVGLGVGFLAVAAAITTVRLIDVFVDPIVALLMDRTKTPIGRYRPWLLAGLPLVLLGLYQLLMPSGRVSPAYMILWLVVAAGGTSMITLGLAAWSAVLAKSYDDRSRLFAWTQALALVGTIVVLLLPVFTRGKIALGLQSSMPILGLALIAAFPLAMFICTVFTPERIAPIAQRPKFKIGDYFRAIGRPTMFRLVLADLFLVLGPGTTGPLYVYFFHDAKGFTIPDLSLFLIPYFSAGILGAPFWGRVSQRFGKHRTVQIACVCYSICQAALIPLPRLSAHYTRLDTLPMAAAIFGVGFCYIAFPTLLQAMVADVADEVKLEQKQDQTSLLFSMVTTMTKIGGSITVAIVFPILALVHYSGAEGVVNPPRAILGLEILYLLTPIILVWIGGAMFFGYRLDAKRHGEIRADLDREASQLAAAKGPLAVPLVAGPAE